MCQYCGSWTYLRLWITSWCFSTLDQVLCSPGRSGSDLFYVSSVLKVTQPEVCSKTDCLTFSLCPSKTHSRVPSLFLAPWNNFRTICGLASHVVYRGCSLGCWTDSFSHTGVPQWFPSVFQCCYTGLDVIPTFTLMCGDVVGKLIADILGLWCQSFFISHFLHSFLRVYKQLEALS